MHACTRTVPPRGETRLWGRGAPLDILYIKRHAMHRIWPGYGWVLGLRRSRALTSLATRKTYAHSPGGAARGREPYLPL